MILETLYNGKLAVGGRLEMEIQANQKRVENMVRVHFIGREFRFQLGVWDFSLVIWSCVQVLLVKGPDFHWFV